MSVREEKIPAIVEKSGEISNEMEVYTVRQFQRKLTSIQDLEIQVSTSTATDTTAASMVAGPVRLLHSTGGTAFKLFEKTVYLILNASW